MLNEWIHAHNFIALMYILLHCFQIYIIHEICWICTTKFTNFLWPVGFINYLKIVQSLMYSEKISMHKNTDLMQRRYLESGKGGHFLLCPVLWRVIPSNRRESFKAREREIISTSQTYGQKDPFVLRLEKYFLISLVSLNHPKELLFCQENSYRMTQVSALRKAAFIKGPEAAW